MSNTCECCKKCGKAKRFVRRMDKNSRHSMVIPERFVNHFTRRMPGNIKLEAPDGNVYDVGVTKHRNRTIFQSGWETFLDANNIVHNNSLMFRYLGGSYFKVALFDSSGCEKVVPCPRIKSIGQEPITSSVGMSSSSSYHNTQLSVSRSDGCHSGRRGNGAKRAKTYAASSPSEDLSGEDNPYEHDSSESDDHIVPKPLYILSVQCYLTEEQVARIVTLVDEIQPDMPLLVTLIRKPNVKPYPDLVIPKDYATAYFPHRSQIITFQLAGQTKTWHCKFRARPDGGRCNLYGCYFVRDNHLLQGDLCLFQPMTNDEGTTFTVMTHVLPKASIDHPSDIIPSSASTKMTSQVCVKEEQSDASRRPVGCESGSSSHSRNTTNKTVISSPSEESDDVCTPPGHDYVLSRWSYLAEAQKEKVVMLIRKVQPRSRVFVAIMRKSNVQPLYPCLIICKEYATVYFPRESASVTLQRPGKSKKWHPRFYKRKDGSMHKIRGQWSDFVCDNRVEEGDICIFVPAKGGRRSTFTVHLLRVENDMHAGPSDEQEKPYILSQTSSLSPLQQSLVEDKTQAIQSEAPLYVAIMNNTSVGVNQRYTMEFGAQFAAVYLPKGGQTMLLQHTGKIWHTKMRVRHGTRWVLGEGWRKFVIDNRLQVGDICLFELKKNRRKLTMVVHIIFSHQC
ncbi:B3 domain-containing protein Os03g0619600 isoform X2 [Brachypodium distachyon]|uniref:TF-B3 domain-containing protein n=1 Tax=Brachypodium distachyon TaxID=15368 RepID=A0A0Q3KSW1_BRADI|nr:B3 domain-containing protein Os03g0619600 isoform X2 [Brachypodium distachyon]KQK14153.1 hypothetical protein BRADI_1g14560v3 [Brachypodium distachyon]PNT74428.1 hypothetical protein BRADI_1g14560v3 [Brachypodium distachyon]|eukprot:XP_010232591.1 B3 domain-containing protein Os03g0619600 isoform X2 [Brachypodium distachyon]